MKKKVLPYISTQCSFYGKDHKFFNTQISKFNLMKNYKDFILRRKSKINQLKHTIKLSCDVIDRRCLTLNSNINLNPIFLNQTSYYSKDPKDITMTNIKEEISSLGKEINKKGFFVTISEKNVSKGDDPNKMSKIFISENKNNIFSRAKLAEKMNPSSVLKFKTKLNKEYKLNINLKKKKVQEQEPYRKFLIAYNKEYKYAKQMEEKYSVKTNSKASYLFTL